MSKRGRCAAFMHSIAATVRSRSGAATLCNRRCVLRKTRTAPRQPSHSTPVGLCTTLAYRYCKIVAERGKRPQSLMDDHQAPGAPAKPVLTDAELATHPTVYAADALKGQVVVVSGGTGGIGRAVAWLVARLGGHVAVV